MPHFETSFWHLLRTEPLYDFFQSGGSMFKALTTITILVLLANPGLAITPEEFQISHQEFLKKNLSTFKELNDLGKEYAKLESEKKGSGEQIKLKIETTRKTYFAVQQNYLTDNGFIADIGAEQGPQIRGSKFPEIDQRIKEIINLTGKPLLYKASVTLDMETMKPREIGMNAAEFVREFDGSFAFGTPEALSNDRQYKKSLSAFARDIAINLRPVLAQSKSDPSLQTLYNQRTQVMDQVIQKIFEMNAVKYQIDQSNGKTVYHIPPGSESSLNHLALFLLKKHNAATLVVDPQEGIARSIGGSYNFIQQVFTIGLALDILTNLKNSTAHHELLHAKFDNMIDPKRQTVFSLLLYNQDPANEEAASKNGYLKFGSLEEVLTHLQDAYIMYHKKDFDRAQQKMKTSSEIITAAVSAAETILADSGTTFRVQTTPNDPNYRQAILNSGFLSLGFDSGAPNTKDATVELLQRMLPQLKSFQEKILATKEAVDQAKGYDDMKYKFIKRQMHGTFIEMLTSEVPTYPVTMCSKIFTLPIPGL